MTILGGLSRFWVFGVAGASRSTVMVVDCALE
jgi:hypothetical protein